MDRDLEFSFMDFGNGFITKADLRFVVTKLGAKLKDEEVSDMVRVIRDAGGGVYIGDEDYGCWSHTSHVLRWVCAGHNTAR